MNERLNFFLENQIKTHIDLNDGSFLNGFIIKNSNNNKNVWWIMEDKLGEVVLFSKDIVVLQQWRGK